MAFKRIDKLDLVQIADRQRTLLFVALGMLVANVVSITLFVTANQSSSTVLLGWIIQFALALVGVVALVRLSLAMSQSVIVALVSGLLLVLPAFGLLILLAYSNQASMVLNLAGARVGFLGVNASERDKIRPNHCRGCGYAREGIELLAPCPECGREPIIW